MTSDEYKEKLKIYFQEVNLFLDGDTDKMPIPPEIDDIVKTEEEV